MLEHKGTQTIETARLILRRICREDGQALFENCFSLPEVTKYLRYDPHRDISDTYKIIDMWVQDYKKPDNYFWVITLKDSGEPIGTLACVGISQYDSCGDLGYQLAMDQWGKGYMSEAMTAVLKYMLLDVGFNRLEAYHSVNNPASGAVMRRCGMQYEGMCRQKYYCSQGYQDAHMYAILKSDLGGTAI